jgi:hypothetical protein
MTTTGKHEALHPELKTGEMFLTNCSCETHYNELIWKSKRKGKLAYDIHGEYVIGLFPVFVNKKEYAEHMAKLRG